MAGRGHFRALAAELDKTDFVRSHWPRVRVFRDDVVMFSRIRRRSNGPETSPPQNGDPTPRWAAGLPSSQVVRVQRILDDVQATEPQPYGSPTESEYQLWRAGQLSPFLITGHLDRGRHVGPSVDIACKAQEPEVDLWETGWVYPRWDQTVALAELVGVRVQHLAHLEIVPQHHPDRPQRRSGRSLMILSFEPSAVKDVTADAPLDMPAQ